MALFSNDPPEGRDRSHAFDTARKQRFDRALRAVLYRFDCPSPDDLAAHAWGDLSGAHSLAIDAHLKTCASCAAEHADFLAIRPAAALATFAAAVPSLTQTLDQWAEPIRRFVARLISSDPALRLALRGESDEATEPRIYAVDELGWQVMLMRIGNVFAGQVLGPDETELAACQVSLIHNHAIVTVTQPDAAGWFELQQAPTYGASGASIWVDIFDRRIEINTDEPA